LVNATAENTFTHHNGLRWLAYPAGRIHPRRGANRRPDNRDLDTLAGLGDKPAETGWRPNPISQRGGCIPQRLL
jgi:hypothetical protein